MTTTVGHEARKHTALMMAVYTLLLAIGAALPLAASYQPGLRADAPDGEIECGGYSRAVQADESEEEQAGERPRRRTVQAEAPSSLGSAPAPRCGSAAPVVVETVPRPPPAPEHG